MLVELTGHREPDKRWDTPPAHSIRAGKLGSPLKVYNNRRPQGQALSSPEISVEAPNKTEKAK